MEKFDFADLPTLTLAGWRFKLEEYGAQCPTLGGIYGVVTLFVGSLDMSKQCKFSPTPGNSINHQIRVSFAPKVKK